ncbi:MAG: hypothetical protein GY842_13845 [bacterium]|nr:hypothetical protein [bacterium]
MTARTRPPNPRRRRSPTATEVRAALELFGGQVEVTDPSVPEGGTETTASEDVMDDADTSRVLLGTLASAIRRAPLFAHKGCLIVAAQCHCGGV